MAPALEQRSTVGLRSGRGARTVSAATAGSSCSQKRSTAHSASLSRSLVCTSPSTFAASLGTQCSRWDLGRRSCRGQQCQKHPSTSIVIERRGNAMSTRMPRSAVRTGNSFRNRSPRRGSSLRSATSGLVSVRLFPLGMPLAQRAVGSGYGDCSSRADRDLSHDARPTPPERHVR